MVSEASAEACFSGFAVEAEGIFHRDRNKDKKFPLIISTHSSLPPPSLPIQATDHIIKNDTVPTDTKCSTKYLILFHQIVKLQNLHLLRRNVIVNLIIVYKNSICKC